MTFTSVPANYSSINDLLVYVMYDANSIDATKLDYKYVIALYIDGILVYSGRSYPRPSGSFGVFDLSNVIRSYVNATYTPGTGILAQESGKAIFRTADVIVTVQEEYNGATGAVVLTDSARVFFNHYNDRGEDQTAIAAFVNSAVTVRERIIELISTSAYYFLPYFATTTAPFNVVINGVTTTITPTQTNTLQLINIAPVPNSITGLDTYTVVLAGLTYTVNVVCKGLYTNYVLHFLNKYGGFESMLFNKVRRRSIDIEKKEYNQSPYSIDNSGVLTVRSGIIMKEQRTTFAVSYNEKLKVQTDLLSDTNYKWLAQLNTSPMVFLEDAGQMYPVVITSTTYEYREYIADKLTTLQLDIEFTQRRNTQSR